MNSEDLYYEVDDNEACEYVQNRLIEMGYVMQRHDISLIVDLYYDYLESVGI